MIDGFSRRFRSSSCRGLQAVRSSGVMDAAYTTALFAFAVFLLPAALAVSAHAVVPQFETCLDPRHMDLTVRPGDDFYRYANGNWLDRVEIPDDRSTFRLKDIMYDKRNEAIQTLIEEVSGLDYVEDGSAAQMIRDLYNTGMDAGRIEAEGTASLDEEFKRIENIETAADVQDTVADLHAIQVGVLFTCVVRQDLKNSDTYALYLYQGGLGLPDRDYYLGEDARSREIRAEYVEHVARMFELLGDDTGTAAANVQRVMQIETRLAGKSMTRVERRNQAALYNKMDIEGIRKLAPGFDWGRYFKGIRDEPIKEAIVGMPDFFKEVGLLMQEVSPDDWKAYLRWHVINGIAEYMSSKYAREYHRFFGEFLSGKTEMQDRMESVVETISAGLGDVVGRLYVERYFPPESKARMLELAANLKTTLERRIRNLEWMNEATKKEALEKLKALNVRIGYPDRWKDYSRLEIRNDSYLLNLKRIARFLYQRNLSRLVKRVDPDEWTFPPQIPNAGYVPQLNEMFFPAGFLQPPVFNPGADDAVVYGSIGFGIAHEMIHAFDDQGRKFDKNGDLQDWWTEEDVRKFHQRTRLLVEQYSGFTAAGGLHVDGELTLGENIADFGGLTVAYDAYRMSLEGRPPPPVIDGFTHEQRFFLAFAQFFRGKIRDKALMRMVKEDKHPWGRFRVNGAPFNIPEFYDVFDIRPGDRLYRAPEQRPVIW